MTVFKQYKKIKDNIQIKAIFRVAYPPAADGIVEDIPKFIEQGEMSLNAPSANSTMILEDKFLETMASSDAKNIGFMPPAVRYVSLSQKVLIFEGLPGFKTISFSSKPKNLVKPNNTWTYNIAVPWQLYVVNFDSSFRIVNLYAFYTKGPINNLNAQLYKIPLTNVYSDGRICMPKIKDTASKNEDLGVMVADAVARFWSSSFNMDLYDNLSHYNCLDLTQKNRNLFKELKIDAPQTPFDYINFFSSLDISQILDFNFVPGQNLKSFIHNPISYPALLGQLNLRNC